MSQYNCWVCWVFQNHWRRDSEEWQVIMNKQKSSISTIKQLDCVLGCVNITVVSGTIVSVFSLSCTFTWGERMTKLVIDHISTSKTESYPHPLPDADTQTHTHTYQHDKEQANKSLAHSLVQWWGRQTLIHPSLHRTARQAFQCVPTNGQTRNTGNSHITPWVMNKAARLGGRVSPHCRAPCLFLTRLRNIFAV